MPRQFYTYRYLCSITAIAVVWLLGACHITRHVGSNQYLLRSSTVVISTKDKIKNKGELTDNLGYYVQKPNSRSFFIPIRLIRYNGRYKKFKNDTVLRKSMERPVIFDTLLSARMARMQSYMFTQGYFYARIKDTVRYHNKRAYVTYTVYPGKSYLVNKVSYDVDDSAAKEVITDAAGLTGLQKGTQFTFSLLEDERSRITNLMRNNGYYRFTQDNVAFVIDTFDKALFKGAESPFESAIHFVTTAKKQARPTIDINAVIRPADDAAVYVKYKLGHVYIYPDNASRRDTTVQKMEIGGVVFKYNEKYVHPKVLYDHIYLSPHDIYSQENYDKTIVKLNELGIFQYIHAQFTENPRNSDTLDCDLFMNRSKKHDFSTNYEISSGSTYSLGNSVGVNFRDRNFAKGANLLTIGVNGGVELAYNEAKGKTIVDHFSLLTEYYGVNASLDFPKFLTPVFANAFDNVNLPHTIISVGTNVIDRVDYFTLVNTSANFGYSWHQSPTITWTFSPVFVNIIRLPEETDSFRTRLDSIPFLRDSYKQNFIEGENITFTYSDRDKKRGQNYSYLKLGLEEAGALLSGINQLGYALNDLYKIDYAQYTKFDFDARHYFSLPHSLFALRFYGGVGIPYGQSTTLPYIKQYFVGGPYSLRGWRIRTLGPGSYYDAQNADNSNAIDRTGDIKLELNGEYRFPIAPLFAGAIKLNGALFSDAGNIWLAHKDSTYAAGELALQTFGQDIAVDVGVGLRFDIASFLTLRVDLAMPVKKPYVHTNGGWVFDQINPASNSWRTDNLIPQISIGYPF